MGRFVQPGSFFWSHAFDLILITCCQSAAENTLICLPVAAVTQLPPTLLRVKLYKVSLFVHLISAALFPFVHLISVE